MDVRKYKQGEIEAYEISGENLSLTVLPRLGGKVSSICWRGQEVLALNPLKPYRLARYAAPYPDYDASGFDECFPTIAPCSYPEFPWQGAEMPDHGELWSIPWTAEVAPGSVTLTTGGVRIPYRFSKRIDLPAPGVVRMRYSLHNPTHFPIHYLWSSHPLFVPRPGMRIYLPDGASVLVDWSKDGRLGDIFQAHPWPLTQDSHGNPVDLSQVLSADARLVDKLYSSRLEQGWCLLYDPEDGRYAAFVFPVEQVPFVGLSINMGGWPVDGPGYYNLGIEPCSGYPDSLQLAVERGVYSTVQPHTTNRWEIQLHLGETKDVPALTAQLGTLARALSNQEQPPEGFLND